MYYSCCIWLSGNRLHSIPVEISRLRCLRSLDISHNKIFVLPKELCEIETLESIIVDAAQMHYPSSGLLIMHHFCMAVYVSIKRLRSLHVYQCIKSKLITLLHNTLRQLTSIFFLAATSRHVLYALPTPICCCWFFQVHTTFASQSRSLLVLAISDQIHSVIFLILTISTFKQAFSFLSGSHKSSDSADTTVYKGFHLPTL